MSRIRVVQVSFRSPSDTRPLPPEGYSYTWSLPSFPRVGEWVIVEGGDEVKIAIIVAIGRGKSARGLALKPVLRLASPREIEAVHRAEHDQLLSEFLAYRKAVGLKVARFARAARIAVPPISQVATSGEADAFGKAWWGIWKRAERFGRPADELTAYEQIALNWFTYRDALREHEKRLSP